MNPFATTGRNGRKVLVPLATLLVAGAVAVGSGATFTSNTAHSVSVTSGTLTQSNSHDGLTMAVTDLKPGDTQTGTVTITNTGSLDEAFTLKQTAALSTFVTASDLQLKITEDATTLYSGDFGSLATSPALTTLKAGDSTTVTFAVSMAQGATDAEQGKTASADFSYDGIQTGDNSGLSWK